MQCPRRLKTPSTAFLIAVSTLAGSLLLTGCGAISPKSRITEADLPTPESWQASPTARAGVDTDWVGRFKDSRLRDSDGKAVHHHDGVDPWSDDLS